MTKQEILGQALKTREQEVLGYQINIDNYERALQKIHYMRPSEQQMLIPFREQLNGLLATELVEQMKAKVMLSVIKDQLEEMNDSVRKD